MYFCLMGQQVGGFHRQYQSVVNIVKNGVVDAGSFWGN